jgi:hypothetical protein
VVATERLHGCVIDDAHWFAQRFLEVESDPAFAPDVSVRSRFCRCAPGKETRVKRRRIPNRQLNGFDLVHHRTRRQFLSRLEIFFLAAREIISFTFEPPTSITRILFFKIAFGA